MKMFVLFLTTSFFVFAAQVHASCTGGVLTNTVTIMLAEHVPQKLQSVFIEDPENHLALYVWKAQQPSNSNASFWMNYYGRARVPRWMTNQYTGKKELQYAYEQNIANARLNCINNICRGAGLEINMTTGVLIVTSSESVLFEATNGLPPHSIKGDTQTIINCNPSGNN